MDPMLVGRDRELAELDLAIARVAASSGALYLLSGEPGIGKTRLAGAVAAMARKRGLRTAGGRCWEAGGAPAFWPWREALEGLGLGFPEGAAMVGATPAEARFSLFREIAKGLVRAPGPLLIVLEDLHAADHSTLLLLEFMAGQLAALPLLLLGTYRDVEARLRPDAGDALARIGRAGRVLQLARLGVPEVARLVRESIASADERLVTVIHETTQGNPLFVDEVVRDVTASGLAGVHIDELPIPLGVREIIRQRLSLVSEQARRVLEAGAVLGVEFGASEVERMLAGATAVLDGAAESGLVTARGDRFRFSHALYREALYHELPRVRRQALHGDAARALVEAGAPLAETAHHLLLAGPEAAEAGIDRAIAAAGHALDMLAFEDAIDLLERARAAVPQGPLAARLRCRVLIALGAARVRGGDVSGRELAVEAAAMARAAGDAALLAQAGLAYGAVFTMGGVEPVLVGLLEDALARLPAADSPLRARAMARLSAARQPSPPAERERDIQLALASVAMARRVAGRRELLEVLHAVSGTFYGWVEPSLRLPIALEQERLAAELGDTARLLSARTRLAYDHLELADFAAYARMADTYAEHARHLGRGAAPWRVPLMRSMLALVQDRFAESERWQEEARRIEPEQPRARRAQALHRICYLRAAERHAELRAAIPELRGIWLEMPYGLALADARVASVLARIGADDEVRALLAGLPESAFRDEINAVWLAEAIWSTGDARHAAEVLAVARRFAERWMAYWFDCEIVESPTTRPLAYLAAIGGDWEQAERWFAKALREVEDAGRRSVSARMRFELGDLMLRLGREPERAAALLAEARAGAAALGLEELAALIDRRHPPRLASLAPPAAPPRAAGPAPAFAMVLEGEYYALTTTRATLRFKATRGMHYLAHLVERPGASVHGLELAGAGEADRGDAGELLDGRAFGAYRARLEALRDAAEEAGERGDSEGADRARSEMEAIARELAKASGPGGRARRGASAVDRARSAVQRRLKDALERIAAEDAALGAWLRRAIQTGSTCSYRPDG
jgi:hypothetical protein